MKLPLPLQRPYLCACACGGGDGDADAAAGGMREWKQVTLADVGSVTRFELRVPLKPCVVRSRAVGVPLCRCAAVVHRQLNYLRVTQSRRMSGASGTTSPLSLQVYKGVEDANGNITLMYNMRQPDLRNTSACACLKCPCQC